MTILPRSSGLLMHISSLNSPYGIGDLGQSAYDFVDFLSETGTRFWQILPLNPTGFGNSPYQGLSAFAGNPLLINPDFLKENNLLKSEDFENLPIFPIEKINYDRVIRYKNRLFRTAHKSFLDNKNSQLITAFEQFKESNQFWLEDFCLFMSIRENFKQRSWKDWPNPLKLREPQAILFFLDQYSENIDYHAFLQFIFQRQWENLKSYSHNHGVHFIGDIPIFLGYDCADVWSNPQLFLLDANLEPQFIAGVPPDYFSPTGQLWGNPLYDWEIHKKNGYHWWKSRIKSALKFVDLIRLDHFRGFQSFFQIPAEALTAENGEWVKGPGIDFFNSINAELKYLPFIAEDLGVITEDVHLLRDFYELPGMKVLQFGFGEDAGNDFLPHNYSKNCVAYTGTHDNPSSLAWFKFFATEKERQYFRKYFGSSKGSVPSLMVRAIWASVAALSIAPLQDILSLGINSRMNTPATVHGNWQWRIKPDALNDSRKSWLAELNEIYGRSARDK